ncbi:MAG: methyltransferase domain-containing protein [Betaproteobacteria bacterium]|nr:methyltransferase domain-containing protein [Betaproteobacteria bacterium]
MTRFDPERMERMYGSPPIAEQRARTRAALAARPGERGLDIGTGVGFLACELAKEVGAAGHVTGIDLGEELVDAAREKARRSGVEDQTTFKVGDATSLEIADGSLDFVAAVQVYLYVKDIDRALREAARVLKPGGRLAVVDTDWDSCVWLTSDRARHHRIMEARVQEFAQPHLPPMLPRLLQRAGFALKSVEAIPVLNREYDPDSFSGGIIDITAKLATKFGVEAAEAAAWADDLKSRTAEGEYFFSVNRYLFLAARR